MEVEVSSANCAICSQPWKKKFMLCCDKCDRWFHGQCQGQFKNRKGRQWYCSLCSGRPYGEWQPPQRKKNAVDDNLLQKTKEVAKKGVKNDIEVTGNGDVLEMPAETAPPTGTKKSKLPLALSSSSTKDSCLVADAIEVTGTELHKKGPSNKKSKVLRKLSLRCSPSVSESGSLSSDFETPQKKQNYSVTGSSKKSKVVRKLSLCDFLTDSKSDGFSSDLKTLPKEKKKSVTGKLHKEKVCSTTKVQRVKKLKLKLSRSAAAAAADSRSDSFSSDFETPKKKAHH